MYKWTAYFLLWALSVITFQVIIPRALDDSVDLYYDLEWDNGGTTTHYDVPDVP